MARPERTQTTRRNGKPELKAKPVLFHLGRFFETAAQGRAIAKHQKNAIIFSQGDVADAVFYIKEGKVKVVVVSKQARRPWLHSSV
jgi:CRP-like cAMP-binding protein